MKLESKVGQGTRLEIIIYLRPELGEDVSPQKKNHQESS
jgi:hypothetical protein